MSSFTMTVNKKGPLYKGSHVDVQSQIEKLRAPNPVSCSGERGREIGLPDTK